MNGRKNVVGLAFAHHCILRQSSTLIIHLYFSSSLSFMFFWRPKERKAPAHGKISQALLCSGIAVQYPLVEPGAKAHSFGELKLPSSQTLLARNGATSILSAVCRVLRIALRTAIFKKYNCRTTFGRTSHNGRQTAGISVVILTLPVFL